MWHALDLKALAACLEQTEDSESGSGVAAAADATVVSQFGEGFASDYLRDNQQSLEPSLSLYCVDRPAMVAITTIQGRDQKPAVRERAQRRYTVSSMVSDRSGGPWRTPAKANTRST